MSDAPRPGVPVPAARATRPGWRDPRLWIGVAVVAASVVVGARILASADDTVQVWAADSNLGAGTQVDPDQLVAHRVRFDDSKDLVAYYRVSDELPADLELTRPVGAGELLPRSAVGSAEATGTVKVPIAVDDEQVPSSVTSGSVVDIYLIGTTTGAATGVAHGPRPAAAPALAAVTVVEAPAAADSFGATGKRQLVLAVPEADAGRFFAALGALDNPVVTVVQHS